MVTATQSMTRSDIHRVLCKWPVSIKPKRFLISNLGESIPFAEFITGGNLLLVDRGVPDTAGAQCVIIDISTIVGIKITDAIEMAASRPWAFRGTYVAKKPDVADAKSTFHHQRQP